MRRLKCIRQKTALVQGFDHSLKIILADRFVRHVNVNHPLGSASTPDLQTRFFIPDCSFARYNRLGLDPRRLLSKFVTCRLI